MASLDANQERRRGSNSPDATNSRAGALSTRKAVRRCLELLSARDRQKLVAATVAQIATSLLDLAGVLLLGLVGTLAVTTAQGLPPTPVAMGVADTLGLGSLSAEALLALLATLAAVLLLVKSVLSSVLVRRVFKFLASRQAVVSARLARLLLSQSLTFVKQRSSQETSYALVQGASSATLVMLGQAVVFVSEASLLLLLGTFLLIVSPAVAVCSLIFFAAVALILQLALGKWALKAGQVVSVSDVESLEAIQEALGTYREISVTGRRAMYVERIEALRWRAANSAADLQFISTLPKYVFEAALVFGGFALAVVLLATQPSATAVGTLALFLAAATRVMPSILRLQGAAITMRNAAGFASSTLNLAESLGPSKDVLSASDTARVPVAKLGVRREGFVPEVQLNHVTFTYPLGTVPAISDVSLTIPPGGSLALVGTSGAGKSTLADLILGVLQPQSGRVLVGSVTPDEAIQRWPGAIAYVPQDVAIANTSVRLNVALGLPDHVIRDDMVWEALDRAQLRSSIASHPDGLECQIGERGFKLSGGERQRLGIARALFSEPKLLVLDEATSALDADTERALTDTILSFEGAVTTIVIAHRLSTVRHADQVLYLEKGRVAALGTFQDVRREVPSFDRQSAAMGLS